VRAMDDSWRKARHRPWVKWNTEGRLPILKNENLLWAVLWIRWFWKKPWKRTHKSSKGLYLRVTIRARQRQQPEPRNDSLSWRIVKVCQVLTKQNMSQTDTKDIKKCWYVNQKMYKKSLNFRPREHCVTKHSAAHFSRNVLAISLGNPRVKMGKDIAFSTWIFWHRHWKLCINIVLGMAWAFWIFSLTVYAFFTQGVASG
jgi:hypothetical protein